ncbi:iron-sulfur cluster carrier protein ApbC [Pseudoalteromonas xiamenensis]
MFNIKKWFSSDDSTTSEIYAALSEFKSAECPLGIPKEWVTNVSAKSDSVEIKLTLPFAAKSLSETLSSFLSSTLAKSTSVATVVHLPDAPKFKQIQHIVLVASGKGGVGKSTTAINLAYALKQEGAKVGVLDGDIYGPSIPKLLGLEDAKPVASDDKTLLPLQKHGVVAQSIGFLVPASEATVWRGPMASQALNQLLNETAWGELDYLIVDMPPGTGDIQLTMSQKVPASGAVIVTTPQDLALADAQKGIAMFSKVNMPILGLIENMSYFICGHCGQESDVFGRNGGKQLAMRHGVPLIAEIPLHTAIREQGEKAQEALAEVPDIELNYRTCARILASTLYYQNLASNQVEILITDD